MTLDKNEKHDEAMQCLKEGAHQVSQQIDNWIEERSIAGVIEINGMTRREDFGEVDKWMCQPRDAGKHNKRNQNVFKVQTQLNVKELLEKKKKHCAKQNLGLTTKLTNPLHAQKIRHIAEANIKISSEKWYQNHVETRQESKKGNQK